jgi:DnaK suppressor protein
VLTPDEVERFRRRLEADRAELESRIAEHDRGVTSTVSEEDGAGDPADESVTLFEREQAIEDEDRDRDDLAQIDRALQRIAEGTYGLSEVSGKPIPKERLEALPSVTTLVDERPPERE